MSDYEGSDTEDIFKTVSDSDSEPEIESDSDDENETTIVKPKSTINNKITTKQILTVDSDQSDDEDENEYEDDEIVPTAVDDDLDDEEDDDEEDDLVNLDNIIPAKSSSLEKIAGIKNISESDDEEEEEGDDEDEDEDENYQKFDNEINKNYVLDFHPECFIHNYDEISVLTKVYRDKNNVIIDPLHRTIPFLTKYERARILGQRAKQINAGARPFVKIPENVIDGHLVAELELQQKKIPFIIRRPLPGSGSEYWNLKDLELISF